MASLLLGFVLWNCDVRKGIKADRKNASVTHVAKWIVNNIPGDDFFILAQELKTTIVQGSIQTELEIRGHVLADGKRSLCEALVYYVSRHKPLSKLVQRSDLQRVSDSMKYETNAPDLGRMSVQMLDHPEASLLVVSWHGMWNSLSDGQLLVNLRSMMDFIEKMRQTLGCRAVIIGGDFNLPSHKAIQAAREASREPCFRNATVLHDYELPPDRSRCIDYILWWSDGSVVISQEGIKVIKANKSEVGTNNFDHPVIHYTLQVHILQIPRNPSEKARSAHGRPYRPREVRSASSAPAQDTRQTATTKAKYSPGMTTRDKPSSPSPTVSQGKDSRSKQDSASSTFPPKTTKAETSTVGDTKRTTPSRDKPSTPSPTASAGKSPQGKQDTASSMAPSQTTKTKTSTAGDTKRTAPPKDKPSTSSPTASAGKSPPSKQDTAASKSPSKTTKTKTSFAGETKWSTAQRDKPSTPTATKPPRTPRAKSAASKEARKGSATGSGRQSASLRYPPKWEDFLGTNEPVPAALWERPPQSRGRAKPQHFFQWSSSDTFL